LSYAPVCGFSFAPGEFRTLHCGLWAIAHVAAGKLLSGITVSGESNADEEYNTNTAGCDGPRFAHPEPRAESYIQNLRTRLVWVRGSPLFMNAAEDPPRMVSQRQKHFDWDAVAAQPADVVPACRAAEYPTAHSAHARRQIRAERTWRRCVSVVPG